MTPERWLKIKQLFEAAVSQEPKARSAFLAEACRSDPSLAGEVESLISAHTEARSFLESPPLQPGLGARGAAAAEAWPITDNQRFRIAGEHARGGLGRILTASDQRMGRMVAVKELLGGGAESEARFVREAMVTGRLQHPAIVPVYEIGRWPTGNPFYTMKMVNGRSLAEVIREKKTLEERLSLLPNVIAVADAIAYAHSQRVIHRDLKPSNVLIGPFGETVVIDWGLAADLSEARGLADPSAPDPYRAATVGLTMAGAVMGTPQYMPPEQARGDAVDERADVYALGAMLYHLLAGVPPYDGPSQEEVLDKLIAEPPLPIETIQPRIPEDLRAIVRKAMARSAADRYPSASELTDDLKRFQTGQLVGAHQYSSRELLWRWLQRYRAPAAIAAVAVMVIVAVTAVSFQRTLRARQLAEQQRAIAEARANEMVLVQARSWLDHDPTAAIAWLKKYPRDGADWREVHAIADDAVSRGVARHVFKTLSFADFSPDGRWFAFVDDKNQLVILDASSHRPVLTRPNRIQPRAMRWTVRFSPDSRWVLLKLTGDRTLELIEIATGKSRVLDAHDAVADARFSPDGKLLATSQYDRTIRLWTLATAENRILHNLDGAPIAIAFSPNGEWIASAGESNDIRLWNLRESKLARLKGHTGQLESLSFSPDGSLLASAARDGTVRLWTVETGKDRVLGSVTGPVPRLMFSSDGTAVAAATADGTVRIWTVPAGTERVLRGHVGAVADVSFSPDGAHLISGSRDGTVRLWKLRTGDLVHTLRGQTTGVSQVLFHPGGKVFASFGVEYTMRLWTVPGDAGRILRGHQHNVEQVIFSPDGQQLASASTDKTARVWDVATGESTTLVHPAFVYRVAFAPDGRRLATASVDKLVRLWDLASNTARILGAHNHVLLWDLAFAPDGRRVFSAGADRQLGVWDVVSGRGRLLAGHQAELGSLAVSADGRLIASGDAAGVIRLWDAATLESRALRGHTSLVHGLAFSPRAPQLASASYDGTVRIWSTDGREARVLRGHEDKVRDVAFSPDGTLLGSGSADGTVRLWNAETGEVVQVLRGPRDEVRHFAFSPDGKLVAAASADGTVRLWDVDRGMSRGLRSHGQRVSYVAFSPDGRLLASAGYDKNVRLWPVEALGSMGSSDEVGWLEKLTAARLTEKNELH